MKTAKADRYTVSLRRRRSDEIQFSSSTNVKSETSQSRCCSASAGSPRLIQFPPSSHEQSDSVWIYRGGR